MVLSISSYVRRVLIVLPPPPLLTDYTCFSGKTTCFLSATKLQATVILNLDPLPLPLTLPSCFISVCLRSHISWFNHAFKKRIQSFASYMLSSHACTSSPPNSPSSTDHTPGPLWFWWPDRHLGFQLGHPPLHHNTRFPLCLPSKCFYF